MEFIARCGGRFLRSYHRAWIASTGGIALGARDDAGTLLGVLLGAAQPDMHFRSMVRRRGLLLGFWLVVHAASHPGFARELVQTRALRYLRGLTRMGLEGIRSLAGAGGRASRGSTGPGGAADVAAGIPGADGAGDRAVGEVTHVMVLPSSQGQGVGRALLEHAACQARKALLEELVLVTPPDLAAAGFYEHLGWTRAGSLTSRSGEAFVRFTLRL